MSRWPAALPLIVILAGCAPASFNVASAARTQTSAHASSPVGPPYAVLVDEQGSSYQVAVIAIDGAVVAQETATMRNQQINSHGQGLDLPLVSTSSTSLYYLDGDNGVVRLSVGTDVATPTHVTTLDVGRDMEGTFAVSPDDSKIAVSVLDYTKDPVHTTVYVDNLTGGDRRVIYQSDSNYVWPVAWHGGLLVLAHAYGAYRDVALRAAPARDNPYWAVSYHVVDPATANRVVLMGSCTVSGPLSPAGSACIQGGAIDWQGNVSSAWSTHDWGSISAAASISPDGGFIAAADPDKPNQLDFWRPNGSIAAYVEGPAPDEWAGWLDSTHVFVPATSKYSDRIVTLSSGPSPAIFINAAGFYAARLPTDIT